MIETLLNTAIACERCANKSENENIMQRAVMLNRDAVELFKQAVKLLKHDSEVSGQFIQICEEVARMTAEECNNNLNIEYVKTCADACNMCADACKNHRINVGMAAPRLNAA
ncbi:MAG: four-helix bundle copper-binding protein [Cytophagaceae bacterium]